MTHFQGYDEREARKVFVRNRQRLVFSIAATILVVATVLSLLVFYGVIGRTKKAAQAQPNYGVTAPCLPTKLNESDQSDYDGSRIDPGSISVRTINGTSQTGLAAAVRDELQNRGFNVDNTAYSLPNWQGSRTTIYFTKTSIAQAYTLGSLFTDAILQMTSGDDATVNVVIGPTFINLKSKTDPSASSDAKLASISGCVAADQMTDLPAAIDPNTLK